MVDLYAVQVPKDPKTTYSASVTGGGTSVNSIPNEVFMEFDMRSESADELAKSIKAGGSGKWGPVPMPAQAALSDADAKTLAAWILSGAK